jgi:hypothetical protein
VAHPPTEEREAPAAQAAREQTTVVALWFAAPPRWPLSLPPLRRARIILLLCRRALTIGRIWKTRRAGFGPAGAGPDRRQLSESADRSSQQQQQPSWSERNLSHILKMSKSTKALKLKKSRPYKYFVPMSIGGVICKAMVDSGRMCNHLTFFTNSG